MAGARQAGDQPEPVGGPRPCAGRGGYGAGGRCRYGGLRIDEYRRIGVDSFIFSGYPHLEEAYSFGELVLPKLPLGHPILRRDLMVNTGPFGETIAGDHKPKLQAAQ